MRASQQLNALCPRFGFVEGSTQIHERGNGLGLYCADKIALAKTGIFGRAVRRDSMNEQPRNVGQPHRSSHGQRRSSAEQRHPQVELTPIPFVGLKTTKPLTEKSDQLSPLALVQCGNQPLFVREMHRDDSFQEVRTLPGKGYEHGSTVVIIRSSFNEALALQGIDSEAHAPRCTQEAKHELSLSQTVGFPSATKSGKYIKGGSRDPKLFELRIQGTIHMLHNPAGPADDLHRGQVQIRPLALPELNYFVDMIRRGHSLNMIFFVLLCQYFLYLKLL
jgi:hypothetical protein